MSGGADFLQLRPDAAPSRERARWLTDEVRAAVTDGRLAAGTVLPATRVLADELGFSRGVVVEAYRRLADEGLVRPKTGSGTVVAGLIHPVPTMRPTRSGHRPVAGPATLPARAGPGIEVDLSPGVPDLSAFPRTAWLRAERTVLESAGPGELGYGDPRGSAALRTALADWLGRSRGVRAAPDGILVVAGVAQSLALLAQVLSRRGVTAIGVEEPGSRGARDQLGYWGITTPPLTVDEDGLDVAELAVSSLEAALLTPAHQFPTGVVLGPERRRALLEWAVEGRLIIEDDYDAEHRYDRAPVPALQPFAPGAVAYTGSTSKSLAPGLRLGWLVAPDHLHDDLVAAKHAADIGSPALPQLVLARLIVAGELERHLRRVRTRQRIRRDALLGALREALPQARIHGVAAGLHLLVTFGTDSVDDVELAGRIGRHGVLVHPLSWHRQRPGDPGLVLGYAAHPPDRLAEAGRRIGAIVTKSIAR